MKVILLAAAAAMIAVGAAQAQQTQPPAPSDSAAVPIEGIDTAALANSARASKLIGSAVYRGDTSIGKIEDLLVDLDKATVTGVVLSVGGVLGVGDKRVAVPVKQIKIGKEARFVTELSKEQLSSAPAFDLGKLQQ
jgi:sporulation protein YlmC with PRC-barrel domain